MSSAKRDLYNNLAAVVLNEASDKVHTNTTSSVLDTAGFQGVNIMVAIGALTGVDSSNYLTPSIEECDTYNGSFTAVDPDDLLGAFSRVNTTALDSCMQTVGYKGHKLYLRVKLTYVGTAISVGVVGIYAVCGLANHNPVTAPTVI